MVAARARVRSRLPGRIALLAAWRTRTPTQIGWPDLARPVVVILWVVAVANLVRMIDDLFVSARVLGGEGDHRSPRA